jgi:peptidoglycan hydrolase-like protein with peptidoglycan-binding domain
MLRYYLAAGTDDGEFGACTEEAVTGYQAARSAGEVYAFSFPLAIDGTVGPKTWSRLTPPTVKKKSKGPAVLLLQETLKAQANPMYDPGRLESNFGPKTEAAVNEVQRTFVDFEGNPLKVDGVVGERTWSALWS